MKLISIKHQDLLSQKGDKVFMGPWCMKSKEDSTDVLPSPWQSNKDLMQIHQEVVLAYEFFLGRFSKALNEIHGVEYSERFWRILIGPYLYLFLNVIYDRYFRLLSAQKKYKSISIPQYLEENFISVTDCYDFVVRSQNDDLYNAQILSRIAKHIGIESFIEINEKNTYLSNEPKKSVFKERNFVYDYRKFYLFLKKICIGNTKFLLYHTGHSERSICKLFFRSFGRISNFTKQDIRHGLNIQKNLAMREQLRTKLPLDSPTITGVHSIVEQILCEEFPLVYLEGFHTLLVSSRKHFKGLSPTIICSSIGWYFDEEFKIWSAEMADRGAKLIGLQHGGNYGIVDPMFFEDHEVKISDVYLTWGWTQANHSIPISPPKLFEIKQQIQKPKDQILFLSTSPYRYLINFPWVPERSLEYISWQTEFLLKLSPESLKTICYRPHPGDNDFKMKQLMLAKFPDLKCDDNGKDFLSSLQDCKLFVCDHLSTTYLEALFINKPTILFWNPNINTVRSTAQPFIDELRQANILHDSPENAALWVETIQTDINDWWFSSDCQKTVKKYCQQYASLSKKPLWDWYQLFQKLKKEEK